MAKMRVLITVKTYPTLSGKYDELVCTAGFAEDGNWVRIYPIAFRKKSYNEQYKKYDWIEIGLVKNTSDFRPESYRPISHDTEISIAGHLDTKNDWLERKKVVLQNVYEDLEQLIKESHNKEVCTSLAVFKPAEIINFKVEPVDREWDFKKIAKIEANRKQFNLFEHPENPFKVVRKLPYKFSYILKDKNGKKSTMMIEDWEIGQLFWNCLSRSGGDEAKAVADVKAKYLDDFAKTKDLFLFLGTSQEHHYVSRNPFMIIGTFHPTFPKPPKIDPQLSLF